MDVRDFAGINVSARFKTNVGAAVEKFSYFSQTPHSQTYGLLYQSVRRDMAEMVDTRRGKGNSIIAALIFQRARARLRRDESLKEERKKDLEKNILTQIHTYTHIHIYTRAKFSPASSTRREEEEKEEEEDNARSFSMTTSRIEMARKMATAPKGEIFEVSNFISLLSLLSFPFSTCSTPPLCRSR